MTDAQLISISITVLAVFGGVLVNNARLGDVSARIGDLAGVVNARIADLAGDVNARIGGLTGDFNTRIGDLKETLRAEAKADKSEIVNMISDVRRLIETNHDTTLRMLADIDQRVTRLEARG